LLRGRTVLTRRFSEPHAIDDAIEAAGLSSYHFQRLFKALFLETPHSYRSRQRLLLARQLLLETDLPVRAIVERCGYASVGTFTRLARREWGMAPGEFRKIGQAKGR